MRKLYFTLLASVSLAGISQAQVGNYSVGDAAPNFTVTDLHGHEHELTDYTGKWVVLDFFTYWCGPCQSIAPILNEFYIKYGCNGYDIIVLGVEGDGTTAQTQSFEDNYGGDDNYPTPTASGVNGGGDAVHTTYGITAFPTLALIGPDGKFKNIDIWPVSGVSTFENAVSSAGGSAALVEHNCAALEVGEIGLSNVAVYPNPTTAKVTVRFSSLEAQTATVELYGVSGQLIAGYDHAVENGSNAIELDLSKVDAGTYFVKVTTSSSASGMIPVIKK